MPTGQRRTAPAEDPNVSSTTTADSAASSEAPSTADTTAATTGTATGTNTAVATASNATDAGSAKQTVDQSNQVAPGTESPADVDGDPVKEPGYFSDTVSADQDHAPAPDTPGATGQAFTDSGSATDAE